MERSYFVWRGLRICISERGSGAPLFLVPGIGCSADMWEPFMEFFPDRRLISFDAPGTGRSMTPLYPVSVVALASLAAAVLDACSVAQADVVGFSYGGAVAQQLARNYPQRVNRLVLAATNCGLGAVLGSADALRVMATPMRFYSSTYFERVAGDIYGGATGRDATKRQHDPKGPRHQWPPNSYGYAMQILGGFGWSSFGFLHEIPHETLVILGDDDPLVPLANGHMLAERIPRAELAIVERAGHLLLWDEPERVAPRIVRFMGREGASAR